MDSVPRRGGFELPMTSAALELRVKRPISKYGTTRDASVRVVPDLDCTFQRQAVSKQNLAMSVLAIACKAFSINARVDAVDRKRVPSRTHAREASSRQIFQQHAETIASQTGHRHTEVMSYAGPHGSPMPNPMDPESMWNPIRRANGFHHEKLPRNTGSVDAWIGRAQ